MRPLPPRNGRGESAVNPLGGAGNPLLKEKDCYVIRTVQGGSIMSKVIRTNFDYREMRRDRRYELPPMVVRFSGSDYAAVNWSLGGFLLADGPETAPGTVLSGQLHLADAEPVYPVSAEFLRHDETLAKNMAFRFVEPSGELVTALDRALFARLMGRPHT
jgi:hypothetical protein